MAYGIVGRLALCLFFAIAMATLPRYSLAQEEPRPDGLEEKEEKEAPPKVAEEDIPPAEDIDLTTKDGVLLRCTYYPGTNGKETVPIIMLHKYDEGVRQDFDGFATYLQHEKGHAIIVPDLRGHGDSRTRDMSKVEIDGKKMKQQEFLAIVDKGGDLETVKSFLVEKHNAQELNIDRLCVIGAEMGATAAVAWAALDWSWPAFSTGKQGQDVKALILLSPEENFKGLKVADAFKMPAVRTQIAVYIAVGDRDSKAFKTANRIHQSLKKYHKEPEDPEDATLYLLRMDTTLQGTDMLNEPSLDLQKGIAAFIDFRLVEGRYPWKERKSVLGN